MRACHTRSLVAQVLEPRAVIVRRAPVQLLLALLALTGQQRPVVIQPLALRQRQRAAAPRPSAFAWLVLYITGPGGHGSLEMLQG